MFSREEIKAKLYLLPPLFLLIGALGTTIWALIQLSPPPSVFSGSDLLRYAALPAGLALAALAWWVFLLRREAARLHVIFTAISGVVMLGVVLVGARRMLYQRACLHDLEPDREYYHCNFINADLSGADLANSDLTQAAMQGVVLSDAVLQGSDLRGVDLQGADLSGSDLQAAQLEGADLRSANLRSANLAQAHLDGADLGDADCQECNLEAAVLSGLDLRQTALSDAILTQADLSDANLEGVDLGGQELSGALLAGALLSDTIFDDANLAGADLSGASLQDASFDHAMLSGATLDGVQAAGVELSGAVLTNASFVDADLRGADLVGADMAGTDLTNASLEDADLSLQDLRQVLFEQTDLTSADLHAANLAGVDLSSALLDAARLEHAILSGAVFAGGTYKNLSLEQADLSEADLHAAVFESCDFAGADLTAANVEGADLSGNNLAGVDLRMASMQGADLDGADLSGANLQGQNLRDVSMRESLVQEIDLSEARLAGASLGGLDFSGASFRGAYLTDADLSGSDLSQADLSEAELVGANFKDVLLAGMDLTAFDLRGVNLAGADLRSANLEGLYLMETALNGANLEDAGLNHAMLQGLNLRSADLSGADLQDADLRNTDLDHAQFTDANLQGALLSFADLHQASGLSQDALENASGLVNGTLLETDQELISALRGVCGGEAVPLAAAYQSGSYLRPAVLLGADGGSHAWSDDFPQEWEPTGVRFAQLVICVGSEEKYVISSTPYCLGTSFCSNPTYLKQRRYRVEAEIRRANDGRLLTSQTFYGDAPRAIKRTESWSTVTSGLTGSHVEYSAMQDWLQRYIAPRSFTCEDPLGCVDVYPDAPIEIGAIQALSGYYEVLGVDILRGIQLAAQSLGDIAGHPIRIIPQDSTCEDDSGSLAARNLANNDWLLGAIGTTCGSDTYDAAEELSKDRILVSPSASEAWHTFEGYRFPGFARVMVNELEQARLVAEFAYRQLGARSMATLHDGEYYGDPLQQHACEVFSSLGGECVAQEQIDAWGSSLPSLMARIGALKPDVIYFPSLWDDAKLVLQHVRAEPQLEQTALIGSYILFSQDFLAELGADAEGVYFPGNMAGEAYYSNDYADFLGQFEEAYGEMPQHNRHAYGYDALLLVADAIERVAIKDPDGTLHIPRQALQDALLKARYVRGLTGTLSCDAQGDCGDAGTLRILQFVDSSPASFAPGEDEGANPLVIWP